MRKALLVICLVLLTGCANNSGSAEAQPNEIIEGTTEPQNLLPKAFETENGTVYLKNIYIQQDETEYGYDGWLALEFDLSGLDEKGQYWFQKDYRISVDDRSLCDMDKNAIEFNSVSEMISDITEDGALYDFWIINESKNPFEEMNLYIDVDIWENYPNDEKLEIRNACNDFVICDDLPDNINEILASLAWKKSHQ